MTSRPSSRKLDAPPPDPTRESPWRVGRRGRRATEWYTRHMHLSNRLSRYAYAKQGPRGDAEIIQLRLAEVRLADVVFAASAIEMCYLRIRPIASGFARIPLWQLTPTPTVFQMDQTANTPRFRRLVASVDDAYRDFLTMLWWGRSLLDRVEGGWGERIRGEWVDHRIGLVEFLPKRDAARMRKTLERLRRGAFAEVRDLADYSLHAFAVPQPGGLMQLQDDGTYRLPLPDRLGKRPVIGQKFTFEEGRHIGAEIEAIWLGVQQFMADAFEVLEVGQSRREEALSGDAGRLARLLRKPFVPPYRRPHRERKHRLPIHEGA